MKINPKAVLFAAALSTCGSLEALIVMPGDVVEFPTISFLTENLVMTGGTLNPPSSVANMTFLNSQYQISSGAINGTLVLSNPTVGSFISGGRFERTLSLVSLDTDFTISGGTFTEAVDIRSGDSLLEISGGTFARIDFQSAENQTINISGGTVASSGGFVFYRGGTLTVSGGQIGRISTTSGAEDSLDAVFVGSNWALDGVPLSIVGGSLDISGRIGELTGTLDDGSPITVFTDSFEPNTLVLVPEPSSYALGLGLLTACAISFNRKTNHNIS